MAIEKRASLSGQEGELTPTDVRDLVKQADSMGRVVRVNMKPYLGKSAVVIIATGDRADALEKLLEEHD